MIHTYVRHTFIRDLERISDRLLQYDPRLPDRFATAVERTMQQIVRQPGIGHHRADVPVSKQGLRFWRVQSFGNWLIAYAWDEKLETVDFQRVLWGQRLLPRALRD